MAGTNGRKSGLRGRHVKCGRKPEPSGVKSTAENEQEKNDGGKEKTTRIAAGLALALLMCTAPCQPVFMLYAAAAVQATPVTEPSDPATPSSSENASDAADPTETDAASEHMQPEDPAPAGSADSTDLLPGRWYIRRGQTRFI